MERWISSCILLFLLGVQAVDAQDRYLAYFIDKQNNTYSVENPSDFLSERAIARRLKANIDIDEMDLPVSSTYIQAIQEEGISVHYSSKWLNAVLLEIDVADSARIAALEFIDRVERVADGQRLNPGSRKPSTQGRTSNSQENIAFQWHDIDRLHENRKLGSGIRIAVMDASFRNVDDLSQFGHLFDENRLIMTENIVEGHDNVFDGTTDHGTRVLSVMAAWQEGIFEGIAPGSEYMLFETEDAGSEFRIEEFNWTVAAEKADSAGADVINTSLGYSYGFTDPSMNYIYEQMDGKTAMISRAATKAVATGMVVVASAGNEGLSPWRHITAPADVAGALAVGALAGDSTLASFSSRGPTADSRIKPDVVSLGIEVPAVNSIGNIQYSSGTSLAAPIITGYAALLLEQYPELDGFDIYELIRNSGNLQSSPNNDVGYGIPYTAIVLNSEDPLAESRIRIFPIPARDYIKWQTDHPYDEVHILDIHGRAVGRYDASNGQADVSTLSPGMYLIRFQAERSMFQFRFVKE